ncbi:MAG TPA: GAF domain-containing protein [Planctomycetota bacterium]|nr:GAF domain-containing protein [Planctomycetota bacterium]
MERQAPESGTDRDAAYTLVAEQMRSLLDGCPGATAAMASASALLMDTFDHVSWVGFYLPADDGSLVVGPYQGPLACIRLPAGQGVCGAAAAARKTVVVPDVHAFPGHIACDTRSRSEIVVPVMRDGRLLAVLDVDSHMPDAFRSTDREGLEALAALLAHVI